METDNRTGGSSLVIGLTITPRTALIIQAVLNFPWIVALIAAFTGLTSPAQLGIITTIALFALALEALFGYVTNPNGWSKAALYVAGAIVMLLLVSVPFVTALDMVFKVVV